MAFGVGLADTAKLIVDLSMKGNFSRSLSSATRELKRFESGIDRTKSKANQIGQHIGLGIRNVIKLGAVASATIAGFAVATLKLAGDFQAQLNTINTIAHATPEGLTKIGDQIRSLARDTGTSLEDLTAGYYDLLSAGIKTADAQNVLTQANRLAIGGLATTAQTVDLLTTAINAYGGDAKKAAYYTDVFAKAIELGKVTADQISSSFANIGPVAAQNGIEIKEVAAAYAALTAQGVPAAEVTTQMSRAILDLLKPNKALNKLQEKTGINFYKLAKNKGLVVALETMREKVGGNAEAFKELFGRVEGYKFALSTTGPQNKIYNDALAAMEKSAGTAKKQFDERQQGLNFQLSRFRILVKDAGIQIGTKLLPKITPLLEKINDFIGGPEGQSFIGQIGDNLASLFTDQNIQQGIDALKAGFQIAKDAAPVIAASAKITQEALKTAVGIFNSLPPEIRALAISAFAVNKLTGGLVTTVTGGLISAVLRQFTGGMNVSAGVVNVNGGVVNGGGVPGAGGGGAGVVGTALGPVGFAAGIAAAASKETADIANREFANKGQTTNFEAPGLGPFGITSAIHNLQEGFKLLTGGARTANSALTDLDKNPVFHPGKGLGSGKGSVGDVESRRGKIGDALTKAELKVPAVERGISALSGKIADDKTTTLRALNTGFASTGKKIDDSIAPRINPRLTDLERSTDTAGQRVVGAIRGIQAPITNVAVDVVVSAGGISKTVTIQRRYGSATGSAQSDLSTGTVGHLGR